MAKGIWKKYEKTERKKDWRERKSYDRLYDDLKDSGKKWTIASDYDECADQLAGEFIACYGTKAGDMYVYYIEDNGKLIPEFYIKITEYKDFITRQIRNSISFNNASLGYDEIDNKYMPELIVKLQEIDEVRNKEYIDELEVRYENYLRLLSLREKEKFTDDELLFLYYMAYVKEDEMAFSMIKDRDIQKDFDSLTEEDKVKLFLNVRKSNISNRLLINSRDVLMEIAKNKCLKQLNNATEEIINDRKYMMGLLDCFFETDKNALCDYELKWYLPKKYQADIDILELAFDKYFLTVLTLNHWINSNPDLDVKMHKPEFAYRLVDSFIRSLIKEGTSYYESGLMYLIPDEILNDIENHVLIGPEPTQQREDLKNQSIDVVKAEKAKVKVYRLRHMNN